MPSDPALPTTEPLHPGRGRYGPMNLAVLGAQLAAWAGLLTLADQAALPWWARGLAVLALCAVLQGVFTMMHEAFHRLAHRQLVVNDLIGTIGATIFGSSFTLHRINHWGHHVRNRTAAERGEFVHPGEGRLGKVALYYFATMGGLWLGGLVFPVVALAVPYGAVRLLSRKKRFNTYSAAFEQFEAADWTRMRLEALLLVGFWAALIAWGPWSWATLAVCYAAFAYHWSVLQWIYHLRTPIDVVEGAYNLRLPTPVRWLWLNFNYNLTHHRRPGLTWQELPANTDVRETQPLWYRYLLMWLPPTAWPEDEVARTASLAKRYF